MPMLGWALVHCQVVVHKGLGLHSDWVLTWACTQVEPEPDAKPSSLGMQTQSLNDWTSI